MTKYFAIRAREKENKGKCVCVYMPACLNIYDFVEAFKVYLTLLTDIFIRRTSDAKRSLKREASRSLSSLLDNQNFFHPTIAMELEHDAEK